jgi:hypothetical protein
MRRDRLLWRQKINVRTTRLQHDRLTVVPSSSFATATGHSHGRLRSTPIANNVRGPFHPMLDRPEEMWRSSLEVGFGSAGRPEPSWASQLGISDTRDLSCLGVSFLDPASQDGPTALAPASLPHLLITGRTLALYPEPQ